MTMLKSQAAKPKKIASLVDMPDMRDLYLAPPTDVAGLDAFLQANEKEVPRTRVQLGKLIGEGEFGEVYTGNFINGSGMMEQAAIKTLKAKDPVSRVKFLAEAAIMLQFDHPNIGS